MPNKGPFIAHSTFEQWEGQPLQDNGQCVRLLQKEISGIPHTSLWVAGAKVKKNREVKKGTAIATFFNGIYPNHAHGNHAAIYISQDSVGIWVIDQFISPLEKYQNINRRRLNFGALKTSNNGDLFYVIESKS